MFQNKHCRSKGENTMKTPLEYTKNLKNHIITPQMLLDCLYSSNKRAKNWRDKEQEYREFYRSSRYSYDKYDNVAIAYHYYLFYSIGSDLAHTFHTPISEDDAKKYNLDIVDIDTLYTEGHDIHDLISNQFVTKVVTLIESGNYMYILNAPKH